MFINFWYPAEWSHNLTDKPIKLRMLGQDFVLFRDGDGTARCLSNTCIHRGASLAGGRLKGDCIECPYHGWQFDGDGRCRRIPSLGTKARIPARARIDAYPTDERYGLVFAFLGDLPEEQRPPIMDVPEFGHPDWHAHSEDRVTQLEYRRAQENALDPAHNEFVHPTHGFSGTRDDYFVPQLDVQDTEWGCGFITTYFAPPLKDKKMSAASGRSENAVIEAGTFVEGPTTLCTKIHPTAETAMHQYAFKTPIDEFSYRSFLLQMRNFLITDEHDGRFKERNQVVADQDREVLSVINPTMTPEQMGVEFFMPADKAIARYREYFKDWEARGWRIDVTEATRNRKRVAYAIPSPGRRRQPKGWILDPVPMLPSTSTGIDQLDADAAGQA
jgi:phenylpropionate dioxygenase-like ring-hydroxylating dioxygenase large terminal subunit